MFSADQSLAWLNLVNSSVGTFLPLAVNWWVRNVYTSPSDRKLRGAKCLSLWQVHLAPAVYPGCIREVLFLYDCMKNFAS